MVNLLVDVGSTFIKYEIYDDYADNVVYSDKVEFPKPVISDGVRCEIPLVEIKDKINLIINFGIKSGCKKVYFSVQMHGFIIKFADGTFSNYISWKDRRGNTSDKRFRNFDFNVNGTSLKNNLPAAKLCVFERNITDAEFFTLGSFIMSDYLGKNVTHITDACASGFYNADSCEKTNFFESLHLPEAEKSIRCVGRYKDMFFYTPLGDHQVSFLGSGAGEKAYLLNIGTAVQLSTLGDADFSLCGVENRPFFYDKKLLTVTNLISGEKLFNGFDKNIFVSEISEAIKKLPPKDEILLGGGGALLVESELQKSLGMKCEVISKNIGMEGLHMVSKQNVKIGTMLSEVLFPNFPLILKNSGIDFCLVDNEHGAFDYNFLASITMVSRLCGENLIVRIPDNSRTIITKLCDMGIQGFLLPMSETVEQVKQLVDYARYSPDGKRGISTNRAHTLYNPPALDEYMKTANANMKIFAQIETEKGCENIDEILSVKGLDGVFIGPNDLSCDIGCIGDNEPIKRMIKMIGKEAIRHKKHLGIITTNEDLISCALNAGADLICYGSEIYMLKSSSSKIGNIIANIK